jgi:hypothetical protein
MKALRILILTFLGIGLSGILIKMLLIYGRNTFVLAGFGLLALALFIQFFLSLVLIKNDSLKIMGAFMSMALSVTAIGVLFRYLYWQGWSMMYMVGGTTLILLSVVFFILYSQFDVQRYRRYITINILVPWAVIIFFGLLGILLPKKTFYNTFSERRGTMTYEEFQLHPEKDYTHLPPRQ